MLAGGLRVFGMGLVMVLLLAAQLVLLGVVVMVWMRGSLVRGSRRGGEEGKRRL